MQRDRLAALRAQRNQGQGQDGGAQQQAYGGQGGGGYEMAGFQPTAPPVVNGNGAGDSMSNFYEEITNLQDMIKQMEANVSRISELHSRTLGNMDEALNQQYTAQLEELVAQTRALSNEIKRRIEALGSQVTAGQDSRIRKNQITLVRNKFMEALQSYQTVEKDYRARYKQRVERQFKIVKPEATPQEVAAVVNDSQGGNQIFAQAISSSNRYGESRAAYREVQERHEDIRRIEQTLTELAQLFNDMSVLVQQQDEQINNIEATGATVQKDTEAALNETEKAVKHARSARRKRWIFFWLVILIIIIIVIIVIFTVKPWEKKSSSTS